MIGRENKPCDAHARDELEDGIEDAADQLLFMRKEKNVAHESASGIAPRYRVDAIFRTFLEQKERVERGGSVGADASELTGERRAVGAIAGADTADIGNFVGENDRIGRSQARHGGFTGAGNAGEEERAVTTNRASGVNEKATFFRENERVDDAENGVDGIGIGALMNLAAARAGIPCGTEVAALDVPEAAVEADVGVLIGGLAGCGEMNIEGIGRIGERI